MLIADRRPRRRRAERGDGRGWRRAVTDRRRKRLLLPAFSRSATRTPAPEWPAWPSSPTRSIASPASRASLCRRGARRSRSTHARRGVVCRASAIASTARTRGRRPCSPMAEQYGKAGPGVAFMRALESAAAETIKPLPINVDGAMAAVLSRSRISGRRREADLHRRADRAGWRRT